MTPTLYTPRLELRSLTLEDAPEMQRLIEDPEIADFTLTFPYPVPDGFAEGRIRQDLEREGQPFAAWGMFLLEALEHPELERGAMVGRVGLGWEMRHRRGGLGYWVARAARGQGLMTEALLEVVRYGLGELGLHRLEASHFPRNPASGRVLEKAGFTREGLLRGSVWKEGKPEDVVQYAILSSNEPTQARGDRGE